MRKNEAHLYIPAFISILLMIILATIFTQEMKKKNQSETLKPQPIFEIDEDLGCNNQLETYKSNIKTLCIKEIYYLQSEEKTSLRASLNDAITMEDITKKMEIVSENEKYIIYQDTNNLSNKAFRILKCNNYYIIGLNNLEYKEGMCD